MHIQAGRGERMVRSAALDGQEPVRGQTSDFEDDPVLARVQMSLAAQMSQGGDEIFRLGAGTGTGTAGGEIMNKLASLMMNRPQTPAPTPAPASSGEGGSTGKIVMAGIGALANGVGAVASQGVKAQSAPKVETAPNPPPDPNTATPPADPAPVPAADTSILDE